MREIQSGEKALRIQVAQLREETDVRNNEQGMYYIRLCVYQRDCGHIYTLDVFIHVHALIRTQYESILVFTHM